MFIPSIILIILKVLQGASLQDRARKMLTSIFK